MDAGGCRIVTRFKTNTLLAVTADLDGDARNVHHRLILMISPSPGAALRPLGRSGVSERASGTLSDRIGLLPRNPFGDPVHEIRVRIEAGKVLCILCNALDASAQEIADLYKYCGATQTLKIRHFLGSSETAVRIQIAVALIAFLLLHMARTTQKVVESPLAFAHLVRANLMHRKRIGPSQVVLQCE